MIEPEHLDLVLDLLDTRVRSEDFFGLIDEVVSRSGTRAPLTIAETAEAVGVTAHTLRYYERAGLIQVDRDTTGNRVYDANAQERVVLITRLRTSGMPIATIRRYTDLLDAGEHTDSHEERLRILTQHRHLIRQQVAELLISLVVTDYKVARYDRLNHGGQL